MATGAQLPFTTWPTGAALLPLPLALVEQRPYTHICTLVAVLLCGCTPLLYSSVDDFAVHILQLH